MRSRRCSRKRRPRPRGSRASPTSRSACPRRWACRHSFTAPPTQRECGLVCFFHVSESRDRLHEPRCTDLGRLWRPPPGAGQELEPRRLATEATAQQCPPPCAQAGAGGRARAESWWQSGRSAPTRSRLHPSAPSARRPGTAPQSRLRAYVRRDAAGGGPEASPRPSRNQSPPRPHRPGGEGGSPRAFESGARAARPPSRAGDRCVTRGAGSPRAEAGAGSGRGAPSGEWGLAAA